MASINQINANRANGRLGGVKTEKGKEMSKVNSFKHGLNSSLPILNAKFYNNGEEEFEKFKKEIIDRESPRDGFETFYVNRIIDGLWREQYYKMLKNNLLNKHYISIYITELDTTISKITDTLKDINAKLLIIENDHYLINQLQQQRLPDEAIEKIVLFKEIMMYKVMSSKVKESFPTAESNASIWEFASKKLFFSRDIVLQYCADQMEARRIDLLARKRSSENTFETATKILDTTATMEYYFAELEKNVVYVQASARMERVMAMVANAYNKLYGYRAMKDRSLPRSNNLLGEVQP